MNYRFIFVAALFISLEIRVIICSIRIKDKERSRRKEKEESEYGKKGTSSREKSWKRKEEQMKKNEDRN